jgi:hypothetical protein
MSIPANITAELANLQAQVTAAGPLAAASAPTLTAMQLNAAALVSDINAALAGAAGALDTWMAPTDPAAIVTGILALETNADDQASLANMAGYAGRALKNLDQVV